MAFDSPGSIVRSSISGCRPLDPGSNPGLGATSLFKLLLFVAGVMSAPHLTLWTRFLLKKAEGVVQGGVGKHNQISERYLNVERKTVKLIELAIRC